MFIIRDYTIHVVLLIQVLLASTLADLSSLCQLCHCANPTQVYCDTHVEQIFYDPTAWKDQNYTTVTITNNDIYQLRYTFPASNLTELRLIDNGIAHINDSVFKNLQNMQILDLSHNNLEVIQPDAFQGIYKAEDLMPLKSLKELHLDYNKLSSLNMDLFDHMTQIQVLSLSHNPLKIIDKHTNIAITNLLFLKKLDLSYTEIQTLPDGFLHTPKYLKELDLSGNPLETIPKTLEHARSLEVLYLNNTGFHNLTKDTGFPEVKSLKVLYLCHTDYLVNITKHALGGLQNLEELYVTDNLKLTRLDSLALAGLNVIGNIVWPNLKKLHLENNKIAYLDSDLLGRWDGLSDLNLNDNPWTCECENQWMVDELIPTYVKINEERAKELRCAAPIEMIDYTFYQLKEKKSNMRCLDLYGARPERDAAMLVGVLAGVLIAIPLVMFVVYAYLRHWFGLCDRSPAAYSRQFYQRQLSNDDYF